MKKESFKFTGEGKDLFLIYIKNLFLTLFSLGLYFPWALVEVTQFNYRNTFFKEKNFDYTGKGIEIFKGFLKALLVIIGVVLIVYLVQQLHIPILDSLLSLCIIIAYLVAIPFILHNALRYDSANTTYNQIRFGYRGDLKEFITLFVKNILLTIVTLGVYSAWLNVNITKYTTSHTRLGSIKFDFKGEGADLLLIHIKGILFTIFTLGIYSFWWTSNVFNFRVNNTKLYHNDKEYSFSSTATGGSVFMLLLTNTLLIIFTLGFGTAWADVRMQKYICENCLLDADIDVESIEQTEPTYHDAIGEAAVEMLR